MSERAPTTTRERADERERIGAVDNGIVPARDGDALAIIALRGQRTIGAFTRNFSIVGALLAAAGIAPFVEGTWSTAILASATIATIVAVSAWARPWTLEIGLDGVRCWPTTRGAVVPWSFLRSAELEAIDPNVLGPGVTVKIRYVILWVTPRAGERWPLPAYANTDAELEAARDAIVQRAARASAFVEPDATALIRRDARSLAQWKSALLALRDDPFRSAAVELRALRSAIESGALEPRSMVECAFALAALGAAEDRRWLALVARAVLAPVTRAAIEACADNKLADVAIERATLR